MAVYAIFLDIDGVFTSTRCHIGHSRQEGELWGHFDKTAVEFLNLIDEKHNIDWVLMSTWSLYLKKDDVHAFHWVNSCFRNAGFRGRFAYPNWKVENPIYPDTRAHSVKKYLDAERLTYSDFLCIDDTDYNFNAVLGKKRFVRTHAEDGMLKKHMLNILSITGEWDGKD